jgi:acyl dehydratase
MKRTRPSYAKLAVGDELPPITKPPITTRQLVMYAGASSDYNAIHYDDPFARASGFPSVIAHGMLSMAFLGELAAGFAGGPAALLRLGARFRAVTFPGDVITCSGTVTDKRVHDGVPTIELKLTARNQAGAITVEGAATLAVAP